MACSGSTGAAVALLHVDVISIQRSTMRSCMFSVAGVNCCLSQPVRQMKVTLTSWLCVQGPLVVCALLVACAALVYRNLSKQVYLLDFACFRPADDWKVTWKRFMEGSVDCKVSAEGHTHCSPVKRVGCHSQIASSCECICNVLY